jgi:N-acetylglucosaminyldiphosphoundecaprenol N-acetyl-beta-D-mannosaminyltransferase
MLSLGSVSDASTNQTPPPHPVFPGARFLGITVNALTAADLTATVAAAIAGQTKMVVAPCNLHSVSLLHHTPLLQKYYARASVTYIDGMSLVLLAQLYGYPFQRADRTSFTDWIPSLMETARASGWRLFYLGSTPTLHEIGTGRLRTLFPGLSVDGRHGYFDTQVLGPDNGEVLAMIEQVEPHILMVGMGQPRQELWIYNNYEKIAATVILPCGAALDYVAGGLPVPPRWLSQLGLEWAFRLSNEPGRLAHRYLIEPWPIISLLVEDILTGRFSQRRHPSLDPLHLGDDATLYLD